MDKTTKEYDTRIFKFELFMKYLKNTLHVQTRSKCHKVPKNIISQVFFNVKKNATHNQKFN